MSIVSLNENEDFSADEELSALIAKAKIAVEEIKASIQSVDVSDPDKLREILDSIAPHGSRFRIGSKDRLVRAGKEQRKFGLVGFAGGKSFSRIGVRHKRARAITLHAPALS